MSWQARALLCDLDGVIRHWPGHGRARGERAAGLPSGVIRELAYGMEFALANLGVYTHEQWLASVCDVLVQRYGHTAQTAIPLWDADPGTVDPTMLVLLRRIQAGRTPIALLTNNTTALRRDLARHKLTDLFEVIVNSAEVEVVKPAPLIYRIAARELRMAPEDILFIDDKLANVLAARHVGMHAEQFTSPDKFITQMAAAKIPLPAHITSPASAEPTRGQR